MTDARYIAVWLFIIGIYIGAPLKIGHVPIPAFLAGVAGMFLLVANSRHIKKQHVLLLLGLGLLAMLGVVANIGDGAEMARLKGAGQLLYSVAIAYGLFLELWGWGKEQVASLFQKILLLIIVGCFLELYTDFKGWSDSFRSYVFEDGTLYRSEFREVFGKVRPKLFTIEPSYVAIFFLLAMTMWYTLAKESLARSWKYFLLTMVGMFLIDSQIVLLTSLAPVLNFLFLKEKRSESPKEGAQEKFGKKLFIVLLYSSGMLLAMLTIWQADLTSFVATESKHVGAESKHVGAESKHVGAESKHVGAESRLELILSGRDDSFTGRLIAPPVIAYRVLNLSPWFGVGLEAKEKLNEIALEVFKQLGMQTGHVEISTLGRAVTNVFWLHWIYFGLAGGVLMMYWIYKLMRLVGVRHPLYCFFMIGMFTQTMGGYVTPRFWFISFLIMLLGTLQSSSKDDPEVLEYASDAQN